MSAPRAQNPLNGGYDQSLLAATPEVSKAAKQEGYNVDLLDEPRQVRGSSTPRGTDLEAAGSKENYNTLMSPDSPMGGAGAPGKVPFWRTRGGIIGLAVLAIVIVGAIVGGAVGGTVGKSKNNDVATQAIGSSSNSTTPAQGQNPASTANSGSSSSSVDPNASKSQQSGPASTPISSQNEDVV